MRKKRENVPSPASYEQMREVIAMVVKAVPRLSDERAKHFIGRQRQIAASIRAIFSDPATPASIPYHSALAPWVTFYRTEFGLELDPATVCVPDPKSGFGALIVVIPGITIERVLAQCAKYFKIWRWTSENLDTLITSTRTATTAPYAVWHRAGTEADAKHASKSYNALQQEGAIGVTLLEYLLYHLFHFRVFSTHLDPATVTLCAGSLRRDGFVASAHWSVGNSTLYVYWCHRDGAKSILRVREVIPVP